MRGTAAGEVAEEIFPEYATMAQHYLGEDGGREFIRLVRQTFPGWARIAIRPEAVAILDFETRFASAWSSADRTSKPATGQSR